MQSRAWQPDDLWVGKEVVKEGANILDPLRSTQVQQDNADAGHTERTDQKGLSVAPKNVILGTNDTSMDLLDGLDKINEQLQDEGFRLRIEQRGRRLNLRGLLPTRNNPDAARVQRLSPGLQANSMGLREAEQTVRLIERQLNRGAFRWEDWRSTNRARCPRTDPNQSADIAVVIDRFQEAFFADPRRRRSPSCEG